MHKSLACALFATTALAAIPAHANVIDELGPILATAKDAGTINARCDKVLGDVEGRMETLASETGPATLDKTLVEFDEIGGLLAGLGGEAALYRQTMADQSRRDAGAACEVRVSSVSSKLSLSRPIYDRLSAIDASNADDATKYYLKRTLDGYRTSGVGLDDTGRAEVQKLQDEIAAVGTKFDENIANGQRSVKADPSELEGLPQDFIAAHPPGDDGKVTITTDYPDYVPVMSYAKSDDLRMRLSKEYNQRAYPENDTQLRQLLHLRQQLAEKLGFRNYAELVLQDKMVNSPEKVETLLDDMAKAAEPASVRDMEKNMAVLKQLEPDATEVKFWQTGWLSPIVKQRYFDYDPQEARKYFAYNDVRDGILQLTEDLFDVEIVPWKTATWDPDVETYEMRDHGKVIGRFYFDSHPRPGKYSHANMIPLRPGVIGGQPPVAALVMNLPKGDHSTGLMEHSDVETFLHEFGHMLHGMFGGRQHWFGQSGITTEWDFVEAPSQMLENWVYDYDTLAKFAKDKDGNVIPRELVEKMNKARYFNLGLGDMIQLGYSNVSLQFHQQPVPEDLGAAQRYYRDKYAPVKAPDFVQMQDSFGHLNNYSAIYYTYRWSKVIADDLFTRFEKDGLRNKATALAYRKAVLEKGGTEPAAELVKDFLGRDVSLDAYRAEVAKDQ